MTARVTSESIEILPKDGSKAVLHGKDEWGEIVGPHGAARQGHSESVPLLAVDSTSIRGERVAFPFFLTPTRSRGRNIYRTDTV